MEEKQEIIRALREHISLVTALLEDQGYLTSVNAAAGAIAGALEGGNKVLFFGNGGSAADAQHLAAELTGRFLAERCSLAGMALSCNSSSLTAIGNDYGFDMVFARQLGGLGVAGDVAFGISTSGNSPNVLRAMEVAGEKRLVRIAMTGRGGKLPELVEHCIRIPADATPRIQEAHILTGHILVGIVERKLLAKEC